MRLTVFIAVSVLHLVISVVSGPLGFAAVMAAFDGQGSDVVAGAFILAWRVLFLPLIGLSSVLDFWGLPDGAKVGLVILNSLIWGAIAGIVTSSWQRWRQRAGGTLRRAPPSGLRGAV
jgi:hypothetical protein